MKKVLLVVIMFFAVQFGYGQAAKQLNFGIIGVSYDIPVATNFAITPFAGSNLNLSWLTFGVKGNYYFDNMLGMPESMDLYAGANAGYALGLGAGKGTNFFIGLQVGFRWFWNEKWGLYVEAGAGNIGGTGGLGLTMKL